LPARTLALADWGNFNVIVGSSAGALTGLMFVVIALSQEMRSPGIPRVMRSFATPTIVHFTAVLSLAAVRSMPGLSRAMMGATLLTISALLFGYVLWIFRQARKQDTYAPDVEDWIWHFCLPGLAYASILVGGALEWSSPEASHYVIGVSMLVLLIIGIHNAWDSAVWTIIRRSSS
jgi:hypothetical protein